MHWNFFAQPISCTFGGAITVNTFKTVNGGNEKIYITKYIGVKKYLFLGYNIINWRYRDIFTYYHFKNPENKVNLMF